MDLIFYDAKFNIIDIMDVYKSCLWTEAYQGEGEFQLEVKYYEGLQYLLAQVSWVGCQESKNLMLPTKTIFQSDAETGDLLTLKGLSLETLLRRRILEKPINIDWTVQGAVRTLLQQNFIAPTDVNRKIDIIRQNDQYTSMSSSTTKLKTSLKNTSVYEVIDDLAKTNSIGWHMWQEGGLIYFDMYDGRDFSSDDSTGYVEFSRQFDNLSKSNFTISTSEQFTKALVVGQLGGNEVTQFINSPDSGLAMREIIIEANQVETKKADGTDMSTAEYQASLAAYGIAEWGKRNRVQEFTSEVQSQVGYVYGRDYRLGDFVRVVDPFGNRETSRVNEITFSADAEGFKVVPTFTPEAVPSGHFDDPVYDNQSSYWL